MQYFVVIDTNVIVSALLSKNSDAATVQVINALFADRIKPVYNDEILAEYENVLHRPKFHFPESMIQAVINYIQKYGLLQMKSYPIQKISFSMKSACQNAMMTQCLLLEI